jgi:acid phosphatase
LAAQTPARSHLLLPQEPAPNLGQLKLKLIRYYNCTHPTGCYQPEINRQSDRAIRYLRHRAEIAKPGVKLALILDIDETALSNWKEETEDDFGYIPKDWNGWVDRKQAPAIPGTLRLFKEAQRLGVAVFFISGRSESQRDATVQNLEAVGYHNWLGLALWGSHPSQETVTEYKSSERSKIAQAGYQIILNVGDQMSDLNGNPQAEMSVKLPNPFYYIP